MKVSTMFIGSGEFAVPVLEYLQKLDFIDLKAVITQPDKPVGRKHEMTPTPVGEQLAMSGEQLAVLKPERIRDDAKEILEKYKPELIIVAAYGQMIPNEMLEYPKYKCLNLHGSLLPSLRGAVPVPMAILKGFNKTGVTMQVMAEKMDVGEIISSEQLAISSEDTTESLMMKLSALATQHLGGDLKKWIVGEIQPVAQDETRATYCYKEDISKEKAEITFNTEIMQAERMVRAFYPWPVAWVKLWDGKILKVYKARYDELLSKNVVDFHKLNLTPSPSPETGEGGSSRRRETGEVPFVMRSGKNLYLVLENGVLDLIELQLEGKNRRGASDYFFLAD